MNFKFGMATVAVAGSLMSANAAIIARQTLGL
jgi:hypothetical protein